jgi:murein tripeptide amidase MpaA
LTQTHEPTASPQAALSRRGLFRTAGVAGAAVAVASAGTASAVSLQEQQAVGSTEALQLARVWFGQDEQALLEGFDDTHEVYDDGSIQVLLWPGDLARLQATGLRHQVQVADLIARDRALFATTAARTAGLAVQPGETTTRDYRLLADYERDMRDLAARFPDKARLIELPHRTLEKRTVYGLEIATDVAKQDGRAVFYQDGCHHAREWPASEVPIMWAYDLLENYDTDPRIKAIVDNVRNIIVPVVNVDGFHYTRSFPPLETGEVGGVTNPLPPEAVVAGGQGRYVRKNRRPLLSTHLGDGVLRAGTEAEKPKGQDAYTSGVDPNRNYAYSWGDDLGGSSAVGYSQTYRGTDPFSEQESKNVADLLKSRHCTAMITHHTSGNLLLWAWGDTRADAPDNDLLEGYGRAMAVYNKYTPQKSIQLYVTTGTTSDYAYGVTGSIGYTFEHAGSSFHPPYQATVPAMYAKNREALILLATLGCMRPEQRPAAAFDPAAQAALVAQGVQEKLAFGVLTGRAVDASGNGIPAQLTLTKVFDTKLWNGADGNNPLGQRVFRERIETTMTADPSGAFSWSVNPSTRPIEFAAGNVESYLLTITHPTTGEGSARRLVVRRGDRIDLGTVLVGPAPAAAPPSGPTSRRRRPSPARAAPSSPRRPRSGARDVTPALCDGALTRGTGPSSPDPWSPASLPRCASRPSRPPTPTSST